MKFVITVHARYTETDGGLNCLLNLGKMLYERGHDARIYVPFEHLAGYEKNTIYSRYIRRRDINDEWIAIYIDSTLDNPTHLKRVIRYITYGSHWHSHYDPHEITYYHAPFSKDNNSQKFLTPSHWPTDLENRRVERIHESCFIVKKGQREVSVRNAIANPDTVGIRGTDLTGQQHEQLINTFNTTKYFYCYDPCSFLVIMALMCGCIVIQHPLDNYTADEWRRSIGLCGLNGIAYGAENIPAAEATIQYAPEDCMKFKKHNEESVDNFVRDMEELYKPCFNFDSTSPFSFFWKN